LLSSHPLFVGVDPAKLDELLKKSALVHLDADEILYSSGSAADRVFIGISGGIQIEYPEAGEVRGYVAAMLRAPFFLGECQVLHARPWSGTAVALVPVTAVGLQRDALEQLILGEPQVALRLYRELAGRFLRAIDAWKHQPTRTPAQSLSRYLVGYLELLGSSDELRIRQVDLGRATGLRRETVNRVLKGWAGDGLLEVTPKGLAHLDLGALKTFLHELDRDGIVQSIDLTA
jgi:CRP/FNR family transcriptional regulator, cyclic AMP receptor protein